MESHDQRNMKKALHNELYFGRLFVISLQSILSRGIEFHHQLISIEFKEFKEDETVK